MKKFIPCRKCNHKNGKIPIGFYQEEIIQNGRSYKIVKECDHHKVWREENDLLNKFKKAGFDQSKFDYSISTYAGSKSILNLTRLQKYIDGFENPEVRQAILYFEGPNGTQKTTIANWIGKEILKKGFSVYYLSMHSLIDQLFRAERDENIKEELNYISQKDLIIIDESFDKSKSHFWKSGIQIGYLDSFIRQRITYNKGLIFISNNKIKDISKLDGFQSIEDLVYRETKKYNSNFEFLDNFIINAFDIPKDLF